MASNIGKKFVCTVCGSEFIVTKGGDCELTCCDKPMEEKKKGSDETSKEKDNG